MSDIERAGGGSGENPFEAPETAFDAGRGGLSVTSVQWSPTEAIGFGWECVKRDPMVILAMLLAGICMNGISFLGSFIEGLTAASGDEDAQLAGAAISGFADLINFFVTCWFTLGMTRMLLNVARGQPVAISDLFSGGRYWSMVGANFLFALGVFFGFLLLIVPGVILALGWSLFTWLIVDREEGAIDSLSTSWQLTKGHKGNLFLYGLLAFVVMLAGILVCFVGILVAYPIVMLGSAYIYLSITGQPVYRSES